MLMDLQQIRNYFILIDDDWNAQYTTPGQYRRDADGKHRLFIAAVPVGTDEAELLRRAVHACQASPLRFCEDRLSLV